MKKNSLEINGIKCVPVDSIDSEGVAVIDGVKYRRVTDDIVATAKYERVKDEMLKAAIMYAVYADHMEGRNISESRDYDNESAMVWAGLDTNLRNAVNQYLVATGSQNERQSLVRHAAKFAKKNDYFDASVVLVEKMGH